MTDDIDRAVFELCGRRKLSAVSCMAGLQRCSATGMKSLLQFQSQIDVGLHLCLADKALDASDFERGSELSKRPFPAFEQLLWRTMTGSCKRESLKKSIQEQYELFSKKAGRPPDYIDGHLHAHQLPGAREALIEFVRGISPADRPYIRNTSISLLELRRRKLPWAKALFVGKFGDEMLRACGANGIDTNTGFAGIYDFRKANRYPEYLTGFVGYLEKPNDLLVLHPGERDDWRKAEFEVLWDFKFPRGTPNRFRRTCH